MICMIKREMDIISTTIDRASKYPDIYEERVHPKCYERFIMKRIHFLENLFSGYSKERKYKGDENEQI